MLINEVTDITRATPQNRVYHPSKAKVEELVDELHEEEDDTDQDIKVTLKKSPSIALGL